MALPSDIGISNAPTRLPEGLSVTSTQHYMGLHNASPAKHVCKSHLVAISPERALQHRCLHDRNLGSMQSGLQK